MNINHTTIKERKTIKQALKLFNSNATISEYIKRGWTYNRQGSFKRVFIKNNIVVKIGPMDQMISEELRWKRAKKSNKKYLARVFGRVKNMLIQRKVKVCNKSWNCKIAEAIATKLNLEDWGRNHGHSENGTPIFFDCSMTKRMIENGYFCV